jgi:hypothetical protein
MRGLQMQFTTFTFFKVNLLLNTFTPEALKTFVPGFKNTMPEKFRTHPNSGHGESRQRLLLPIANRLPSLNII